MTVGSKGPAGPGSLSQRYDIGVTRDRQLLL